MPVSIHATEHPLSKIFCNDFAFSIPDYQRPYSWNTEQAADLLGDLETAMGDGTLVSELTPYFLGNIVLIKGAGPEAEVVDGQQRLTTLTILLSVLRDLVSEEYIEGVTKYLYEKGDIIEGTPNRYRLRLRPRDADFFHKHVQERGGLDELFKMQSTPLKDVERNVQGNARYFHGQLQSWPLPKRARLLTFLATRCFLVAVSTPDLDSAYRIFSVLNSRGLDLSLTDLLKADVIGAIPEAERPQFTEIWEEEEEDLGREGFNDLFAHIRMIRLKAKSRRTMLSEFRDGIAPHKKPREFIQQTLKPFSDAFESIRKCDYQSDSNAGEINRWFWWLNQIDNTDWVAPAILFLSCHRHQPELLATFFADLERLAAIFLVRRADINERLDRYAKLLSAIENGHDLYAPESPLQLTQSDKEQALAMLNGRLYEVIRIRYYVLLRLDSALSGGATHSYPTITVEHVLPQNPPAGSQWIEWWPDEEQRAAWVHRLGNLLLLSGRKNSEASNYSFARKKTAYFASKTTGVSPFALTTQVLGHEEWTPEVVAKRQAALLAELKALWRL